MVSTLPNYNQSEKGLALGFTNTLVEISKPSFDEDSQGTTVVVFGLQSYLAAKLTNRHKDGKNLLDKLS